MLNKVAWQPPEKKIFVKVGFNFKIFILLTGCQATALYRILAPDAESLTLIMGSFFLKSQTTHFECEVVDKIC